MPRRLPEDRCYRGDAIQVPAPATWAHLTAFAQVFAQATGLALDSPADLQAASVAHWRTFWRCLAAWAAPELGWSGALDPVCEGQDGEHAQFFPALRLNYAASLLSAAIARRRSRRRIRKKLKSAPARWCRASSASCPPRSGSSNGCAHPIAFTMAGACRTCHSANRTSICLRRSWHLQNDNPPLCTFGFLCQ